MRERAAGALRAGAVLAASGPVILTTFGIGRPGTGWFCAPTVLTAPDGPTSLTVPTAPDGPYALGGAHLPGELLFWGVLLLPVAVAWLLLRGSRRATLAAVAAVGVVLAYGLGTAFLLPGPDPCTGLARAAEPPWLLIGCYPVAAAAALLTASRSARPRRPYRIVLWLLAVGAAAWGPAFHRLTPVVHEERLLHTVYVWTRGTFWDDLTQWSVDAGVIGLPVVLVALAATAYSHWRLLVPAAGFVRRGRDRVLRRPSVQATGLGRLGVGVVLAVAVVWAAVSSFTPSR
ncbi:hypothetical protein [Nonomuraea ceibae]|uniref:hypothetical protein n=1 Tax=Nonomuraea ceibae TaxID=1935170 RepID=UPI001C5D2819|nr:hypothetical protein [Nonomuraea ceibae]